MRVSAVCKGFTFLAAVMSIAACGGGNAGQSGAEQAKMPDPKLVAADQAQWQKLTTQADAALKKGDKVGAEKLYKDAAAEAEKLGNETNASAESLANLANFYYAQGDGAQADGIYTKALAVHEKAVGLEHIDLVRDLIGLAKICHSEHKDTEAKAYYDRAVAICKRANQAPPPDPTLDGAAAPAPAAGSSAPAEAVAPATTPTSDTQPAK